MYSYGSPHMAAQKQDDQLELTFSSYVRIQVVVLKTYLGRWTIGRSGERGSGISVLPARYDDDDIYIYIYILSLYERSKRINFLGIIINFLSGFYKFLLHEEFNIFISKFKFICKLVNFYLVKKNLISHLRKVYKIFLKNLK